MLLHGTEIGAGKPVVLLHGLFGRLQNLNSLARRLSASHRVISLDLRNHGASPHAPGMSYGIMADDVLETLTSRDVAGAAVLGHSMGGKVAMLAALTQPHRITRLIVADIAPISYRHANAAVAAAMISLPLTPGLSRAAASEHLASVVPDQTVRAYLLQNLIPGEAPAWRIGLQNIAADMQLIEGFPPLPPTAHYDGPTLFLRGEKSGYVKDAALPVMKALFPCSAMQTVEDAGHWLHADQPDAVAAAVERFLHPA